jgi:hypothetical protein
MRKFGETSGFQMRIKPSSPLPYDMFFVMWRHDIDLAASNNLDTGAADITFRIGFYPKRGEPPPSAETMAPLVEGLLHSLAEVPGASITDATPR